MVITVERLVLLPENVKKGQRTPLVRAKGAETPSGE